MKILTILFSMFFILPSFAQDIQYRSGISIVNNDQTKGFTRPRIAVVNGDVPVVMWGEKNNIDVHISRRAGTAFSSPMKLNPSGLSVMAQEWAGPEMDAKGNDVIVTFKGQPENVEVPYAVLSSDAGVTFGDTVRVTNNNWTRFPTPAIDENGKPYVAFMEFDSGFVDPHYAIATSTNQGLSFNTSVIGTSMAPGEACDCCPASLWADANTVALFFRNNDNNLRDIWTSVSTNSGSSFVKGADIDNNSWMINSCPSSGPDAFIQGDSLVVVWMSGASGASRINIGTADHATLTIGRNFELDSYVAQTANQNYPRISGSGDTIGVVWQESFQGKVIIKGLFSSTGIDGLMNATLDTINDPIDIAQFNPDIAFKNGNFHISWQNNVQKSVLYRLFSFNEASGIEGLETESSLVIYPNPAKESFQLNVTRELIGGDLSIFNQLGDEVYAIKNIDELTFVNSSMLSKGLYIIQVEKAQVIQFSKLLVE